MLRQLAIHKHHSLPPVTFYCLFSCRFFLIFCLSFFPFFVCPPSNILCLFSCEFFNLFYGFSYHFFLSTSKRFWDQWSNMLCSSAQGPPPNFSDGTKKCPFPKCKVPFLTCEKAPFCIIKTFMGKKKNLIFKENLNSALLLADISHINWGL